jgi:hypothetical protein
MMIRAFLAALRDLLLGRPAGRIEAKPGAANAATRTWPIGPGPSEGRPTMNAAYERLMQHLDDREVHYLANGENRSICADFRGEVGTYRIIAAVDADAGLFQVFGCPPLRVPEGARPSVAETIIRANYRLNVGKFEMDFDEGELRFHVSQILTDDSLEDSVIDRLMGTTMSLLDVYLPAILSVIYGNELPKDAIRCAEAGRGGFGEAEGDAQ